MFFNVDSDDYLTPDAIESICRIWEGNRESGKLGICMRRIDPASNQIIGKPYPQNVNTGSPEQINFVWNLACDKTEIFVTDMIKENPFPEFKGERFCTEALWVYQISKKTKREFILSNKGIRYTEYLSDGLTKNRREIKKRNPCGYLAYDKMVLSIPAAYRHPRLICFTLLDIIRLNYFNIRKRYDEKNRDNDMV